jgi:hypothetical protein
MVASKAQRRQSFMPKAWQWPPLQYCE